MAGQWYHSQNNGDQEIRKLKGELWSTRRAIIDLMEAETARLLTSYYSCGTREETYRWEHDVVEKIVALAEVLNPQSAYSSPRAFCPLCRQGSSGPYEQGFSVPVGLSRHLTGWGNIGQCSVTGAAMQLARDHWNDKFSKGEEAARVKEAEEKKRRLKTEDVYLVDPFNAPVLIDDLPIFTTRRGEEEMQWAIDRLERLGFQAKSNGKIKSYIIEATTHAIYADPRRAKAISFVVVRLPLPKKRTELNSWKSRRTFELLDNWKNDLKKKFDAKALAALESLK